MKTAIIYYSKHGTTERVTHLIGEKLTNKVDYISLKECPRPDIRTYDRIILGTAIYAGSPNRKVTQFCQNNQPLLEQKVIGLFIWRTRSGRNEQGFPGVLTEIIDSQSHFRWWVSVWQNEFHRKVFNEENSESKLFCFEAEIWCHKWVYKSDKR